MTDFKPKDVFFFTALTNLDSPTKSDIANEGFVMDTTGHFDPSLAHNAGYRLRREMFLESKDPASTDKWKKGAVPFWGVLSSDYDSMKAGLAIPLNCKTI